MKSDSFPSYFITCPSKKHLGLECPGCGMQRAYFSIYKGKIRESFEYNPGAFPFLFLILFTALHLKFKFKRGHRLIVIGFILTALTMWIAFILKSFW
ncbi:MAG: DUF2752 domain-containing protein [Bacteroidia bacterium]